MMARPRIRKFGMIILKETTLNNSCTTGGRFWLNYLDILGITSLFLFNTLH